ncbi:uncharacterized protein LY89DRAFT_714560 [Mollisia scopiformis]|uniref:Uncharacterized protein n=1 Tax=Mollisia scopiformis TaxID=149040 RepID=A0A194XS28_MOLSC|nr:uncharacterized protein LY89DRAFT_714560 [Mollisia scopiformis]KUJ22854.1 hypothetical protein LY89DRAFT_714560 [Mollisia scopiformis]
MVTLRDLTWPHFVDIDRSKTSSLLSAHSSSSSQPDQILHTSSRSPELQNSTSPVRCVSIVRRRAIPALAPSCARFETCGHNSLWSIEKPDDMSGCITRAEEEALYGPYARLPTPPDGSGEDIGLDINPHLPPEPLSIDCSVCSPDQERYDDLPPLPDSPLAIAKFGFISRESFDTSVRGLVQEEPDSPIGGYPAAPLKNRFAIGNIGTTAMLRRMAANLDGARSSNIQPVGLDATTREWSCHDKTLDRYRLGRTRFSDPFANALTKDKQVRRGTDPLDSGADDSGYTTVMVTAFETPVRGENTDMSHDGARASATETNQENNGRQPRLPDCCISPTETEYTGSIEMYNTKGFAGDNVKSYVSQMPFSTSRPGNVPVRGIGTGGIDRTDFAIPGGVHAPTLDPGLPNSDIIPPEFPSVGIAGTVPVVTGLPVDASGELPTPGTPKRVGKRRRAANKGKRGIRKCRRLILRRPILVLIVGRQLAGPTSEALKLISSGVPIEPDVHGLTEAAGVPAPPPPPPVPAPM